MTQPCTIVRWIVGAALFLALLFLSLQNCRAGDAQVLPRGGAGRRRSIFVVLDRVRDRRRRRACSPARCARRGSSASSNRLRREQRAARPAPPRPTGRPAPGTVAGVGPRLRAPIARATEPPDAAPHGFRAVVAAADPGAVLRAGLDRRAHRHQAPAARVARAAAVVFPRPQLPAERAAGQGDRVVHRGRQGRSADDRPALRARQPVPPPGRDRPRDPHAPEPARPPRPAGRQARRRRCSSSRRTSIAPACSTAPRSCSPSSTARRSSTPSLGFLHLDLRAGEGLAEGDRRHAADGGARQAAVLQGDRALPLRARAGGAAQARLSRRRARTSSRRSPSTAAARARRCCWATSRRSRATPADGDRRVAADRDRRIRRSCRSSPSASPTPTARQGDVAQGMRVLRSYQAQYPSLDLLNTLFTLMLGARRARRGRAR